MRTSRQMWGPCGEHVFKAFLPCFFAAIFPFLSAPCHAQAPKKIARVGFVGQAKGTNLSSPNVLAFRQRLRELGWIEDENLVMEWRFAEGMEENVPPLIADLIDRRVDVLVATGGNPVRIAKKATQTIPIVMTEHANPVGDGMVSSLARPGGNITGMTTVRRELDGKRVELLKEVIPKLSYIGMLWQSSRTNSIMKDIDQVQITAKQFGVKLEPLGIVNIGDLENVLQSIPKGQTAGLIAVQSQLINSHREYIVEIAARQRLPAVYPDRRYAFSGGLMSYGANTAQVYAQAAGFVDKILKGANPAELPIEQPTKFELVINLQAAQRIGLNMPVEVLRWADEVIR